MTTETDVHPSAVVRRFQDAWNAHDVDAVMALMTEDWKFETTRSPPPDGERVAGQEATRRFWTDFFEQSPHATIEIEELFRLWRPGHHALALSLERARRAGELGGVVGDPEEEDPLKRPCRADPAGRDERPTAR